MTDADFHARYAAALRSYLVAGEEASLAVGHELGRQALQDRISMLEIIENHSRLLDDIAKTSRLDGAAALQFLLQTLAALDVATRGFLDGARRYEQQRARAEDLADRDEFRSALVNSLQEGFFVADDDGTVVEINDAFADITGFSAEGLPYRWPHPWVVDENLAREGRSRLRRDGGVQYESAIRHHDGHTVWVAISSNTVSGADRDAYVGTIRDITAARAAAARESAVVRLATAVSVANDVAEVLATTLNECRTAIGVRRVVAAIWPTNDGEPAIQVAGRPSESSWRDLDPFLQTTLEAARHRLPLTVEPVASRDGSGKSRGIVAVLSGDVALWLELNESRGIGVEDRWLVTALVGHLSLAMQHVRQFETVRETSLTLQRAMLAPTEAPAGFAVRYEPAVPPLEIGGDWYDVLLVGEHRIGIIVGDCVGRGLSAAAVMGQLRSSARALLLTGAEPALVLEQLDAVADLIPGAFCTTVLVAVFDTESRVWEYSSAGHVPAVLATPQSEATVLAGAGSVPLAVQSDHRRPQASVVLVPGSTLLLFTDGLVERRGESIDDGIARVKDVLTRNIGSPVDAIAEVMLRELAPPGGYDDDVAIVVCRPPLAALRIAEDAVPDRLAVVRGRLIAWLRAAAISDQRAADVLLAVGEACANSIEHAYRGRAPGTMRVDADVEGDAIHIRVVDFGSWRTPAAEPGTRGRGLALMRALTDALHLDSTAAGTTVAMSFPVPATKIAP